MYKNSGIAENATYDLTFVMQKLTARDAKSMRRMIEEAMSNMGWLIITGWKNIIILLYGLAIKTVFGGDGAWRMMRMQHWFYSRISISAFSQRG